MSALQYYPVKNEKIECSICFTPIDEKEGGLGHAATPKVDHIFHEICLRRWWKPNGNCPICLVDIIDTENRLGRRELFDPIEQEFMIENIQNEIRTRRAVINDSPGRKNFYRGIDISEYHLLPRPVLGNIAWEQEDGISCAAIQDLYDMYEILRGFAENDPHSLRRGWNQNNYEFLCRIFEPVLPVITQPLEAVETVETVEAVEPVLPVVTQTGVESILDKVCRFIRDHKKVILFAGAGLTSLAVYEFYQLPTPVYRCLTPYQQPTSA